MKSFKTFIPIFALLITGFFLEANLQKAEARSRRRGTTATKVRQAAGAKHGNTYRPYSDHYRHRDRGNVRRGHREYRGHRAHRPRQGHRYVRRTYQPAPVQVHTPWCGFHQAYHDHNYGDPYWNLGFNSNGQFQLGIGW